MNFSVHGDKSITFNNQILTLKATGPFNFEYVQSINAAMKTTINEIEGLWGQLTVFYGNSIFMTDALTEIKQSMQFRKSNGLTCIAIVLIDPSSEAIIKKQLIEIYSMTNLDFKFFYSEQLAIQWLKEQL